MTGAPRRSLAVFDVDGTLLPGVSGERLLLRYLIRARRLRASGPLHAGRTFLTRIITDPVMAVQGNKYYLRGIAHRELVSVASRCFVEEIVPRIAPAALREIRSHRSAGRLIVLLSGTPLEILTPMAEHVGADVALGTRLETSSDGVLTGGLAGPHLHGPRKTEAVRRRFPGAEYDLATSWAYADHPSDFEMLQLFGESVVVNASPRVAARAREHGFGTAWWPAPGR